MEAKSYLSFIIAVNGSKDNNLFTIRSGAIANKLNTFLIIGQVCGKRCSYAYKVMSFVNLRKN